jgi:hypothetical protein
MSQKTVTIYHRTVPNQKNQEKIDLLRFFSIGVTRAGDRAVDSNDYQYQSTDVGVIQGWVGIGNNKSGHHLTLRNTVIEQQLYRKKYVVAVDSNLFLYANTNNPLHYLRYSFNGVFPNTGIYCDDIVDPTRWQKISKDLGISLKDYKINGNHILLCLQRNGGWSMADYDVQEWALATIKEIRKFSDRPIIIRGHPGDKAAREYLDPRSPKCRLKNLSNVSFSNFERSLLQDLTGAWAVVNHNSSPVVGAAIEGYPIFVTDTIKSQCREIANTDLSMIESPSRPDRQTWAERLAMFHWNFDELKSGECWQHMRKFVKI